MRGALSDEGKKSSASIVLLPRLARIDQCGGEGCGPYADASGGFPPQSGFVLSGFPARFCAFYFAHGFIVGRCVIIFTHGLKMNQGDKKVNRQKRQNSVGRIYSPQNLNAAVTI
jgi:hypothetical protein